MGPGDGATNRDIKLATKVGNLIAKKGWALLTGGRNFGVMDAASKGAHEAGGLTIGILPSEDGSDHSEHLDVCIRTGIGSARNNINVLSSDVIIACGTGIGTTSEIMLTLKAKKPIILLHQTDNALAFIGEMAPYKLNVVDTPEEAIHRTADIL